MLVILSPLPMLVILASRFMALCLFYFILFFVSYSLDFIFRRDRYGWNATSSIVQEQTVDRSFKFGSPGTPRGTSDSTNQVQLLLDGF
jgi:hypothetical protein